MSTKENLLEKLESRQAHVGIIGLGYVGLPLAVAFAEEGFNIIGVDIDQHKVESLKRGESYVEDVPSDVVQRLV